ncbi:MAG: hypothetical protein OJF52_002441 [Nitrospira sp.]|nr:MAG: hypothetical protein OJF52_002441 [Nitrospira sp.]
MLRLFIHHCRDGMSQMYRGWYVAGCGREEIEPGWLWS